MALLKSMSSKASSGPAPGGQIFELKPDQRAECVHLQGVFLMHVVAILAGVLLLGHLTPALALAPALGVIVRWGIWRFSSARAHPMAVLSAFLAVDMMLMVAGGLHDFSGQSLQSSQEALGLLPIAGYACIVLFDLMAIKSTPSNLAMVGGATSVLLLVQLGVSQSLVNSALVCVLFSMIWVALAARRKSAFPEMKKSGKDRPALANIRFGVRTAFLTLALSIPLTVTFFLLFPRLPIDMLRSEQAERGGAKIGLSDSLSLGSIAQLKKSNDPAFNATFRGPAPKSTSLYWRAMVLDRLEGNVWTSSKNRTDTGSVDSNVLQSAVTFRDDAPADRSAYVVSWDGTDANGRPVVLDGTLGRLFVSFDDKSGILTPRDDGSYALPETLTKKKRSSPVLPELHSLAGFSSPSYRLDIEMGPSGNELLETGTPAEPTHQSGTALVGSKSSVDAGSDVGGPIEEGGRKSTEFKKEWKNRWTSLPPDFNPRTQAFGKGLRKTFGSDEKIISAFMSTVQTEDYHYTLSPPKLGVQAIDDFFLGTRAGFCEHYASAFVVAMRGAGIPARLISGYLSGPAIDARIKVVQSDAHAWAEVWLPERGWVRQDPTASISPSRVDPDAANAGLESAPQNFLGFAELNWRKYSFRAESAWKEGLLSFDADRQSQVFKKLGLSNVSKPLLLISSLLLVIAVALLWQYFGTQLWMLLRPRSRTVVSRLLDRQCRRAGLVRQPGQTWRDLAVASGTDPLRLLSPRDTEELTSIVAQYEQLLYANGTHHANGLLLRQLTQRIRSFKPKKLTSLENFSTPRSA